MGCSSLSKDKAGGKSAAGGSSFFGGGMAAVGEADAALVRWAVAHDIPWSALDQRNDLFVDAMAKIKKAGPSWKPATREVLSCAEPRGEEARAGGLYLALKDKDSEKHLILQAAAKEGGTLVSDGAKLSSRKRGMLNSAIVTWKGELPPPSPRRRPVATRHTPLSPPPPLLSPCPRHMEA